MTPRARLWLLLFGASLVSLALSAPYLAASLGPTLAIPGAPPLPILLALQLAQMAALAAVAVSVGVLLAAKVDLHAPLAEAWARREPLPRVAWAPALAWGTGATAVVGLLVALVFAPRLPAALMQPDAAAWYLTPLSIFYGGVVEEILFRWGMLVALVGAARKLRMRPGPAFWGANVAAALLFAAAHLGVVATFGLTPWVVAYVLVANALLAVLFGWLFRRHGLESAMIAHAAADVWLHVAPAVVAAL